MQRILMIPAIAVALAAFSATDAHAATKYCSESGDQCYGTKKVKGAWHLIYQTFSIRGKLDTCVTPPGGEQTCKTFTLTTRPGADLYGTDVTWSKHFPTDGGKGTYKVRYRYQGTFIGPAVTFRR